MPEHPWKNIYLRNSNYADAYKCPVCKSKDLCLLHEGVEDGIYVEKYMCKDCKARFNNTFSIDFIGVELISTKEED